MAPWPLIPPFCPYCPTPITMMSYGFRVGEHTGYVCPVCRSIVALVVPAAR